MAHAGPVGSLLVSRLGSAAVGEDALADGVLPAAGSAAVVLESEDPQAPRASTAETAATAAPARTVDPHAPMVRRHGAYHCEVAVAVA